MSTDGQSIEAKFQDLMVAEAESHGTCCPACARALAAAVLDALAMYVIDEAVLEGVRAQIEALGGSK